MKVIQEGVMHIKLDIYVFITMTRSIHLMVNY